MNLLEAFGAIFTFIWLFISSPGLMLTVGILIVVAGIWVFVAGVSVPHQGRSELAERSSAVIGGPLVSIFGVAMLIWVVTSSSSPATWGS